MLGYSTGEAAKKLNISVRTLRYYDQIGLVRPAHKQESGKRYYSDEDLLQLEKIILLKEASLSLEDIKKVIQKVTIQEVLSIHRMELKEAIIRMEHALQHTNTLLNVVKIEGTLRWEQLLLLIKNGSEAKERKKDLGEWFSTEEQALLMEKLPKLESESGITQKWINLLKRIEWCIEEGKSPNSKEGRLIAEDIRILSEEMFDGNHSLMEKFWEVRKSEDVSANLFPIDRRVISFIEEAMESMES
ncbi:MerR family transcriptional regulator [Bacillus mangrovi]|uniref:MerR family transcriptional regulator n=1 Tax=Metabacillus mangrovi TaxID=1491830 RepID=A0A7X2V5K4_9BACI|nr:MerR family transcriptional regulator [Metabacillus mangrovi]MTH54269.1 MerR family transcriptional regulator [Metabacillus mangrovi]